MAEIKKFNVATWLRDIDLRGNRRVILGFPAKAILLDGVFGQISVSTGVCVDLVEHRQGDALSYQFNGESIDASFMRIGSDTELFDTQFTGGHINKKKGVWDIEFVPPLPLDEEANNFAEESDGKSNNRTVIFRRRG